jgi:putative spermidine/putrescine transport system permease protein
MVGGLYLALFSIFMLAPLFFVVLNSFNQAKFSIFPPPGLSLQWYVKLFHIPDFGLALQNSLVIAAAATLLGLALGLGASLALVRGRWRRSGLLQSVALVPMLLPKIIMGIAIFIAAIQVGLYPSLTSLAVAHTVLVLPYIVSIVTANLRQVARDQEEAAVDLGANPLQTFWLATMPQIRRGVLLAAVIAFVVSFDEFDVSLFLTRGDNMTLPIRMYLYMQELEDPSLAALSTLLIGVSILLVALVPSLGRGSVLGVLLRRRRG